MAIKQPSSLRISLAPRPTIPSSGSIRFNTTNAQMEMFTGSLWLPIIDGPQSWQEWFSYYAREMEHHISNHEVFEPSTHKREYILSQMQERFPGNYTITDKNASWEMTFNTPADETWFHLQYD